MLSLASKVISDDMFYGQNIHFNTKMPQFGMKKNVLKVG